MTSYLASPCMYIMNSDCSPQYHLLFSLTPLHPFLRFPTFGFAFWPIWFNQGHLCDHWIGTIPSSLHLPERSSLVVRGITLSPSSIHACWLVHECRTLSPASIHAGLLIGPWGLHSESLLYQCLTVDWSILVQTHQRHLWLLWACDSSGHILKRRCYFTFLLIFRLLHSFCPLFHNVP